MPGVEQVDTFLLNDEQRVRAMFHDESRADAVVERLKDPALEDIGLKNQTITAKLAWQPRGYDPHLAKWLHRIDVPTLLVWGAQDKLVHPAYADDFKAQIADARVELIDGAGHVPNLEQPETFNRVLASFLAGLPLTTFSVGSLSF